MGAKRVRLIGWGFEYFDVRNDLATLGDKVNRESLWFWVNHHKQGVFTAKQYDPEWGFEFEEDECAAR